MRDVAPIAEERVRDNAGAEDTTCEKVTRHTGSTLSTSLGIWWNTTLQEAARLERTGRIQGAAGEHEEKETEEDEEEWEEFEEDEDEISDDEAAEYEGNEEATSTEKDSAPGNRHGVKRSRNVK